jgi:hypothetical protein
MSKENFQFLIIVIIVKIKAPLSHVRVTLVYFGCSVFDPSVSCSQNVWIIWLSNLLTLSVPDEGYSNLLTLSVPDEGYSNLLTLSVPDEGYSNLLTLSVPDEGYSRNMLCAVPDEGYSRNVSCTLNLIFTFFLKLLFAIPFCSVNLQITQFCVVLDYLFWQWLSFVLLSIWLI